VIGGFTCVKIGKRLPVLQNIGAAAIFATFIPSALAYYKLLPPQVEKSVIEFTKYTNFLYLFIACIIVGSILGMDRQVLVKGFLKIFVPIAAGSPSPIYASLRVQIATAAAHHAVPVVYGERVMVDAGGLMSYGAENLPVSSRASSSLSSIFKPQCCAASLYRPPCLPTPTRS
jgi:Na+/citrate or Na+/malate symporter